MGIGDWGLGIGDWGLGILHQAHIGIGLTLTAELDGWKHIDIVHLHVLNAVATLQHLTNLNGRHKGGTVHIDSLRAFVILSQRTLDNGQKRRYHQYIPLHLDGKITNNRCNEQKKQRILT